MGSLSQNTLGAIFIMVSGAAFVLNDTLMKLVSGEVSLYQAVFLRGLVATALLAFIALRRRELFP
jgi:drug/metabolite transporter (DMT)-like permease